VAAKDIYRDPVRSSDSHFVEAGGLRWISLMVLAPIPWAGRVWVLPFLTALVPSERACRCRGHHDACRMVQVPSVKREDARRTHRERQRLIAERVQHVNRIKGLLANPGRLHVPTAAT
jgi:hypothetical protein